MDAVYIGQRVTHITSIHCHGLGYRLVIASVTGAGTRHSDADTVAGDVVTDFGATSCGQRWAIRTALASHITITCVHRYREAAVSPSVLKFVQNGLVEISIFRKSQN